MITCTLTRRVRSALFERVSKMDFSAETSLEIESYSRPLHCVAVEVSDKTIVWKLCTTSCTSAENLFIEGYVIQDN